MNTKKNVSLIHQLRKTIKALNLNFMHERKFNGVLNALEMQIEDGDFDEEVTDCLCNAIQRLGKRYKVEPALLSEPIEKLFKSLE